MITTDLPSIQRQAFHENAEEDVIDGDWVSGPAVIEPAHRLFPAGQVFLWLPGLPGKQLAHCTYNESRRVRPEPLRDGNHASYAPPYRVSAESFIAWHHNVTPPFPFHPVPIARTLSVSEMRDIGRRVLLLTQKSADPAGDPLRVLRNDHKCFVLAVLAEMGLLAGRIPQPC